ncbi:MAG: helix-turn-helix domain containing protein [Actinomycetota bacterium]|nr:helix-turn-helix domain containing protein [Actinomycetota bacterium]
MAVTANSLSVEGEVSIDVEERRKRGRPRSKDAQSRIISAALTILGQRGFTSVTIEAVAREAKVGKSTIYRHWKSKTELIEEAIDRELDVLNDGTTGLDVVEDLITVTINLASVFKNGSRSAFARLIGEGQIDQRVNDLNYRRYKAHEDGPIVDLIRHGVKDGLFRETVNPYVISEMIFGAICTRAIIQRDEYTPDECRGLIMTLIEGLKK